MLDEQCKALACQFLWELSRVLVKGCRFVAVPWRNLNKLSRAFSSILGREHRCKAMKNHGSNRVRALKRHPLDFEAFFEQ